MTENSIRVQEYFPNGSINKIIDKEVIDNNTYIITRTNNTYKLFIQSEYFSEGKKICESDDRNQIEKRKMDYF